MRNRTACVLFIVGGVAVAQPPTLPELRTAAATITPGDLLRHVRELSSDAYGGRFPGTPGEDKSVAYVISQIKAIGLQPGSPSGGFVQKVPLYGSRSRGTITITAGRKEVSLSPAQDFVLWSTFPENRIEIRDSDLVFVGYGVVAAEYTWDDYAGIDVKGKTVMVLTGDPPVADRSDPTKLDEHVFLGNALTVYGRTGTKLETAFKHGAAAVILIPPARPARYIWENNSRENLALRDGNERQQVKAQALVTADKAIEIFAAAGSDLEKTRDAAAKPGFRAVELSARITIRVANQMRRFESQNILARIEGSDPALRNEYVIYSAHWAPRSARRSDLSWRQRQWRRSGRSTGTCPCFSLPESDTQTQRDFPLANGRGERAVGIALLRYPPALSSRLYCWEYQSRLFQQLGMGAHQRLQHRRHWQFHAGRPHGRSRSTPGPITYRGYSPCYGLLLPFRPLRIRARRRTITGNQSGRGIYWQTRRLWRSEAR